MNESEQKRIDSLLRRWSAGEQANSARLDRLTARIQSAIDANVEPDPRYDLPPGGLAAGSGAGRTRLIWFSLGVAASLLVAAFFIARLGVREQQVNRPDSAPETPILARIDTGQLHNRATLFRELNDFYSGNLAWMAEVDGRVVLRVGSAPPKGSSSVAAANEPRGRSVTVRVVVVTRTVEDPHWRTLWNADVVAENDQLVEIGSPDGAKHDLAVWAHLLPDGQVAVDTRLSMEADKSNAWNYSGVQRPSVPTQILTRKTGQVEYRVFQTVAVLPEKVG